MDDDGRDQEDTPDNTTTDDEDGHTDEKEIKKEGTAAAHAAKVDEVADDEPHDPDCEPEEDTPTRPQRARRKQPGR